MTGAAAIAAPAWRDLGIASAYVGLPWSPLGRDRSGIDCWGLYRLAVGELTGVWLPSYAERYASAEETAEIEAIIHGETGRSWVLVEQPAWLDMAVFRRGRYDAHVGLVISPGLFVHMIDLDCSKIGRFEDPLWNRIFSGFWRHPAVTEVLS